MAAPVSSHVDSMPRTRIDGYLLRDGAGAGAVVAGRVVGVGLSIGALVGNGVFTSSAGREGGGTGAGTGAFGVDVGCGAGGVPAGFDVGLISSEPGCTDAAGRCGALRGGVVGPVSFAPPSTTMPIMFSTARCNCTSEETGWEADAVVGCVALRFGTGGRKCSCWSSSCITRFSCSSFIGTAICGCTPQSVASFLRCTRRPLGR